MTKLNVLIGCEESQTVTKAFRDLGHNAYSNDLKPCSGGHPEWHLQMDVMEAIRLKPWHLIGLHPECKKLTNTSNRTYAPGKPKNTERLEAVEWTIKLWQIACENAAMVYMENPVGAMNRDPRLPKPQIIQPYFFGDEFQKTTCIWLKNLPALYHNPTVNLFDQNITHVSKGAFYMNDKGYRMPLWLAQTPSTRSEKNREIRSKTFNGIAQAMAKQWSDHAVKNQTT